MKDSKLTKVIHMSHRCRGLLFFMYPFVENSVVIPRANGHLVYPQSLSRFINRVPMRSGMNEISYFHFIVNLTR